MDNKVADYQLHEISGLQFEIMEITGSSSEYSRVNCVRVEWRSYDSDDVPLMIGAIKAIPEMVDELIEHRKNAKEKCVWRFITSHGGNEYESKCGYEQRFETGGPKENDMKFCPCCGREIEVKE